MNLVNIVNLLRKKDYSLDGGHFDIKLYQRNKVIFAILSSEKKDLELRNQ